jgi:hypothetical protein
MLFGGSMSHDDSVAHIMTVEIYDENDKLVMTIVSDNGGTANGAINFPANVLATASENGVTMGFPLPLKAGWYIQWSAGTNMTDATVNWYRNALLLLVSVGS